MQRFVYYYRKRRGGGFQLFFGGNNLFLPLLLLLEVEHKTKRLFCFIINKVISNVFFTFYCLLYMYMVVSASLSHLL